MHFCMIIVLTITDPDSGSLFVIFVNLTGARFLSNVNYLGPIVCPITLWILVGEMGAEFHTGRGSPPPLAPTLENGR